MSGDEGPDVSSMGQKQCNSASDLANALGQGASVDPSANNTVVLNQPVEYKASDFLLIVANITLDLNGQTLTLTGQDIVVYGDKLGVFTIKDSKGGGKLTGTGLNGTGTLIAPQTKGTLNITGGTIVGSAESQTQHIVSATSGATVNVTGGTLQGNGFVLNVSNGIVSLPDTLSPDAATATIGGDAKVVSTNPDTSNPVMTVNDKASLTISDEAQIEGSVAVAGSAALNVEGGSITSTGYAISTHGTQTNADAKITITGGTITGAANDAGVYLPAGQLDASGGTITGGAAVLTRGGTATIGDAAELVSNATTDTITTGSAGHAVPAGALVVDDAGYTGNNNVTVKGGTLAGAVVFAVNGVAQDELSDDEVLAITGGTFTKPGQHFQSYIAENALAVEANGAYSVGDQAKAAVEALKPGDILTVLNAPAPLEVPDGVAVQNATGGQITVNGSVLPDGEYVEFGAFVVAGADRYETAVEIAKASYPEGPEGVVVAAGYGTGKAGKWADALSAGPLAAALNYPVILVGNSGIPESVSAYLEASKGTIENVVIVGGPAAVTDAQAKDLGAYGDVERVFGADRYATSAAIYQRGAKDGLWKSDEVFFATGADFADALSASSYASMEGVEAPIILVSDAPAGFIGQIPLASQSLQGKSAVVMGGDAAISKGIGEAIMSLAGKDGSVRLGGADRYGTSAALAAYALKAGTTATALGAASGQDFPDALAAGPMMGAKKALLLTVAPGNIEAVNANAKAYSDAGCASFYFFGGNAVMPQATRDAIMDAVAPAAPAA